MFRQVFCSLSLSLSFSISFSLFLVLCFCGCGHSFRLHKCSGLGGGGVIRLCVSPSLWLLSCSSAMESNTDDNCNYITMMMMMMMMMMTTMTTIIIRIVGTYGNVIILRKVLRKLQIFIASSSKFLQVLEIPWRSYMMQSESWGLWDCCGCLRKFLGNSRNLLPPVRS